MLVSDVGANSKIDHVNTAVNGVVVAGARRNRLSATYYQLPARDALSSRYDDPTLRRSFTRHTVRIQDATRASRLSGETIPA